MFLPLLGPVSARSANESGGTSSQSAHRPGLRKCLAFPSLSYALCCSFSALSGGWGGAAGVSQQIAAQQL
eukprot:6046253-Amphidinium_carterae.1